MHHAYFYSSFYSLPYCRCFSQAVFCCLDVEPFRGYLFHIPFACCTMHTNLLLLLYHAYVYISLFRIYIITRLSCHFLLLLCSTFFILDVHASTSVSFIPSLGLFSEPLPYFCIFSFISSRSLRVYLLCVRSADKCEPKWYTW